MSILGETAIRQTIALQVAIIEREQEAIGLTIAVTAIAKCISELKTTLKAMERMDRE